MPDTLELRLYPTSLVDKTTQNAISVQHQRTNCLLFIFLPLIQYVIQCFCNIYTYMRLFLAASLGASIARKASTMDDCVPHSYLINTQSQKLLDDTCLTPTNKLCCNHGCQVALGALGVPGWWGAVLSTRCWAVAASAPPRTRAVINYTHMIFLCFPELAAR